MDRDEVARPKPSGARAVMFGNFKLLAADGAEISILNRRARALLAMLCLARDDAIAREQVSQLLWPGRFESHAMASLRQCLLELGKLLELVGPGILNVTRSTVNINSGAIGTDLDDLECALANG